MPSTSLESSARTDRTAEGGCSYIRRPSNIPLKIYTTIDDMRTRFACGARRGERLGFVPTMGALHEGHLSLVRAARASCDVVAASIFVNPTQFGPKEDLAKYPRSFERDLEMLEREGVELLFAPSVEEMYPAGAVTWVTWKD